MTDRPILFSAPMVRALLDGRKTQTRRVIKDRSSEYPIGGAAYDTGYSPDAPYFWLNGHDGSPIAPLNPQPVYQIGDRLWVKETWRTHKSHDAERPTNIPPWSRIWYEADERDNCDQHGKTRVSIHMTRWASRLTLTVTDVRVERLQDISKDDAIAEGLHRHMPHSTEPSWAATAEAAVEARYFSNPCNAYWDLWNSINGAGAWEQNPWVVAISFTVDKRNIDQ